MTQAKIQKWPATITVILGMVASIMASTMINVAISDIMGAYGIGQDRVHWLFTGFLAATTTCMLLNAWFVRNLGPRNTFILASMLFTGASIVGQLAPSFETVVAARIVQGACAGLIQPLGLNVIFMAFPRSERGKAMGAFGVGVMVGPAIGPIVGGVIIDAVDWHFVFTGALPFMVLGAVMAIRYLPGRGVNIPRAPLNWLSFLLVACFVGLFLNGLSSGRRAGWDSVLVLSMFLAAGLAVIAFIEVESRTKHPLLNLKLFTIRSFAVTTLVGFVFGAGMFGTFYLLPVFVRTVQGYSGTQTGLLLLVANLPSFIMFPIAGWIAQRFRPVYPIATGMLMFGVSAFALSHVDQNTSFAYMAGWNALGMSALALVMPALSSAALQDLDAELLPYGAGTMNFIRMLGGALGVGSLAIILDTRMMFHSDALTATQTSPTGATGDLLAAVGDLLARGGVSAAEQLPYAYVYLGRVIAARADGMAFQDGYLVLSAFFSVAAACALILARSKAIGARVS